MNAILEKYLDGKISRLQKKDQETMLLQIGNVNSYVRDDLIYQSFGKLIFSDQLTATELEHLLERLYSDGYLFHQIEEEETDSVFTRSFSVLVIAAIIEYDVVKLQFNKQIIEHTADKVVEYMLNEKDFRGFVKEKGWAHTIAHGADALNALAKHPHLKKESINKILHAIEHVLYNQVNYIDEEEERLAAIIGSLLQYQGAEELINDWLLEMVRKVEANLIQNEGELGAYYRQRNVKNLLKSVYIILTAYRIGESVNRYLLKVLKKWMYLRA